MILTILTLRELDHEWMEICTRILLVCPLSQDIYVHIRTWLSFYPCRWTIINRVFPQLPDLTFLSFLYKIDITGFRISKKKITSTGYWTHNTNPTLRFPVPLTTQPPRHLLNRRFMNWTLIISGLIEHDFKRVWKFEAGMDWQIGWVGKGAGILIVGLVLWVQYPVEAIFFCWFWNPVMSILYKNDRNVRSGNWGKTRMAKGKFFLEQRSSEHLRNSISGQ